MSRSYDNQIAQLTPKLRDALVDFLEDCRARQLRERTIDTYLMHCRQFLEFAQAHGVLTPGTVSPKLARSYFVEQREKWSEQTVASAYRSLRVFFKHLASESYMRVSPMERVALPRADRVKKQPFTQSEIRALVRAAPTQRDKALLLFLLDTGARATEAVSLNLANIDLANGWVYLGITKDRDPRTVYLGISAKRELIKYLKMRNRRAQVEAHAPLWVDMSNGERLLRNGLYQMIRRVAAIANVSNAHPHKFRRTFAVNYLRNGGDAYTLKRIMGHSSLEMLDQYLDGLNDEAASEAHDRASPADHWNL